MLPQFGLGITLAYEALHSQDNFAAKKKARREGQSQNLPGRFGCWLHKFQPRLARQPEIPATLNK